MSILNTFSDWLKPPSFKYYQCLSCGRRFEEGYSSCPDCDGEIEAIDGTETAAYYWSEI